MASIGEESPVRERGLELTPVAYNSSAIVDSGAACTHVCLTPPNPDTLISTNQSSFPPEPLNHDSAPVHLEANLQSSNVQSSPANGENSVCKPSEAAPSFCDSAHPVSYADNEEISNSSHLNKIV